MGLLTEIWVAKLGSRTIEVRGSNHVLRGLVYRLFIDGEEVAVARNFWKLPTRRRLEARVRADGDELHVVVSVEQRWLSTDYGLTVDGEAVPLVPGTS